MLLLWYAAALSMMAAADRPPEASDATAHDQECVDTGDGVGECADVGQVYVIGDLHGDSMCAISWVNRTHLIANLIDVERDESPVPLYERLKDPSEWEWTNDAASLVFMGDYVDKGPTARQTVEFVRALTLAFPDKVTAILGNHELELLRDRDARIKDYDRYSAYSYATVHPGDYHNYIDPSSRSLDEKDDLVLEQIYEASMEVYAHNAHSAVRIVPSLPDDSDAHRRRGIQFAITDIVPPEHRQLARERLAEYQDAYLNTFRSGSPLGDWLERRPIAHLAEDVKTLFVHGGVSSAVGKSYFTEGKRSVEKLNSVWWEHSSEGKLYDFLNGKGASMAEVWGQVVYELLTYRGNHPGYANWESKGTYDEDEGDDSEVCAVLRDTLSYMEGVQRVAVGHTPDFDVRVACNGSFLALDSMIGRWIRGSGNEYCPGPEWLAKKSGSNGVGFPKTSRDGRYKCEEIKDTCEGQIVRLDSDGSINVLTL